MIETTKTVVCDRCGKAIGDHTGNDRASKAAEWSLHAKALLPVDFVDVCKKCDGALMKIRERFMLKRKEKGEGE